ncbi:MAG: hypothetical protein AB7V43_09260 [Acidimicrobiia bacterium]
MPWNVAQWTVPGRPRCHLRLVRHLRGRARRAPHRRLNHSIEFIDEFQWERKLEAYAIAIGG